MIYVYILKSLKDDGYYIGITKNIDNRVKYHNQGKVGSTKRRKPFILIYKEKYKTYKEARIREREIKLYKGGVKFKELISNCPVV